MQRNVIAKLRFLAIAGVLVEAAPVHATPVLNQRCGADTLSPETARLRLEWARKCGTRINVVSPTNPRPPARILDTGLLAGDGVTHLIDYLETDDFFGKNSYSGVDAEINLSFVQNQWRTGAIIASTDANGFQKWTEVDAEPVNGFETRIHINLVEEPEADQIGEADPVAQAGLPWA